MRMCKCGGVDLDDDCLLRSGKKWLSRGVIDRNGKGHSAAGCSPDKRAPFLDYSTPGVIVVRQMEDPS